MCGIVGYTGPRRAAPVLVEGLKRLEYRGYDSAGIAVQSGSDLKVIKTVGKIARLKAIVPADLPGTCGIGHTRWATHGGVTDANAHPHRDPTGKIVLVHNGIVENYKGIKEKLQAKGAVFLSETDTEVIAHLIARYYEGDLEKAVKAAVQRLEGTYGIAVMHADEPGRIVGARKGSPLVVGVGEGEMLLASDVTAMVAHTKRVVYMNDGEVADIRPDGFTITDLDDRPVDKRIDSVDWDLGEIEKEGFSCYMEKEIFEQPESIGRALSGRLDAEFATGKLGGLNLTPQQLHSMQRIKIIAAGTSWHAGLVGAYLLE
ncbi:MAG TPA: isomerizing glutamine--fructose-6-phosphate transaminase, partial [Spirochaetia bacterium]|nr:isomerizing glutamine--fructose-6-phosphate transaminase [Spirochaetia bacterium]